jgi:hypothetical protein
MAFVIPKAAPYVVPTPSPNKTKDASRVESVQAVSGTRPTAKGADNDAARIDISERARELARRALAERELVT